MRIIAMGCAGLLLLAGWGSVMPSRAAQPGQAGPDPSKVKVDWQLFADGLRDPVAIGNAGDGSGRLFILEKGGKVRIFQDNAVLAEPFLDVSGKIVRLNADYDERGLLGIAFHPQFKTNGRFFVYYSAPRRAGAPAGWNHTSHLSEFHVSASDPDKANAASERVLLEVDEPEFNHNGGQLAFGPDGYLYLGLGDGGAGGDTGLGHNDRTGNGQDRTTLLGKILRIDVNGDGAYGIPTTNPFYGLSSARNEIWAWGVRNPWRFSFDRQTGDLYIGDVGQDLWEEIDFQPAASKGGENYGWRVMEGTHCYNAASCSRGSLVLPVAEYKHDGGNCSVTGGYIYRGSLYPGMAGLYFYGDYCTGNVWGLSRDANGRWRTAQMKDAGVQIQSFGEDEAGEIYLAGANGQIYRLVSFTGGMVTPTPSAVAPASPTAVAPASPTATVALRPTSTEEPSPTPRPSSPTPTALLPTAELPTASPTFPLLPTTTPTARGINKRHIYVPNIQTKR